MSPATSLYEPASQVELRHLENRLDALESGLPHKVLAIMYAEKAEQAKIDNDRFFRRVNLASAFGLGFFAASMLWSALS